MKRLVSISLLLMLVAAIPGGASTFLKMDQKALVRDSAAVVQGEVIAVSSFWDKSGRLVVTEAQVRVEDAVFGNTPSVVVVRTFGGKVGNFVVEAHGFPTFRKSERVLLYLEAEEDGAMRVTGYQQGQFRLVRDKAGVEWAVPATDEGVNIVTREGREAAPSKSVRLDVLKQSIRNEARQAGRPVLEN
jgi:hypothetical protein